MFFQYLMPFLNVLNYSYLVMILNQENEQTNKQKKTKKQRQSY